MLDVGFWSFDRGSLCLEGGTKRGSPYSKSDRAFLSHTLNGKAPDQRGWLARDEKSSRPDPGWPRHRASLRATVTHRFRARGKELPLRTAHQKRSRRRESLHLLGVAFQRKNLRTFRSRRSRIPPTSSGGRPRTTEDRGSSHRSKVHRRWNQRRGEGGEAASDSPAELHVRMG